MITKAQIKCGNIDHGEYLLDDIKERLNTRYLNGSISTITDITQDNHTWITVHIETHRAFPDTVMEPLVSYIKGLVAGILLWSGVEVI